VFIHGTALGIGSSAPMALGYLIVACVCFALSRQSHQEPIVMVEELAADD
jgi:hypothetical protein